MTPACRALPVDAEATRDRLRTGAGPHSSGVLKRVPDPPPLFPPRASRRPSGSSGQSLPPAKLPASPSPDLAPPRVHPLAAPFNFRKDSSAMCSATPRGDKSCVPYVSETLRVVRSTETERGVALAGGWGRGWDGEVAFHGAELQFYRKERTTETEGGNEYP